MADQGSGEHGKPDPLAQISTAAEIALTLAYLVLVIDQMDHGSLATTVAWHVNRWREQWRRARQDRANEHYIVRVAEWILKEAHHDS